jgi:hypothetical protein
VNWAHVHLVLTHIPVIGLGAIIAFFLIGRFRGSQELQWISLQMFVALALVSIAVYLTGSPASHQMREEPGVSRELIRQHSNAADFSFTGIEVLGALSLAALVKYWKQAAVPPRLVAALLAIAAVVLGLLLWTAGLGGKIRHPEIGRADPGSDDSGEHVRRLARPIEIT